MILSFDIQEDNDSYTVEPIGKLTSDHALILVGYLKCILDKYYGNSQDTIDSLTKAFEINGVSNCLPYVFQEKQQVVKLRLLMLFLKTSQVIPSHLVMKSRRLRGNSDGMEGKIQGVVDYFSTLVMLVENTIVTYGSTEP